MFAAEIRKKQVAHLRGCLQWRWHLDEVFAKVNGKLCYLWRAVNHEGEVLEAVVTAKRDKTAALKLLKRVMKKYGAPRSVVTDGFRAYSTAMNRFAQPIGTRSVAASTIGRKTRISRFDDESERCNAFEACRRCRNSAQLTARSTIVSTINGLERWIYSPTRNRSAANA